jgi:hypothetical protein
VREPKTLKAACLKISSASNIVRLTLILLAVQCGCHKKDPADDQSPKSPPPAPTTNLTTTQAATQDERLEEKLYGTWVANDVDVKLGKVKIKLTFANDGPMKLAAWSDIPFVGQVRNKSGSYKVDGDHLSSAAIHGGTSVRFWFDAGRLVIQYEKGKTVTFTRQ